MRLLSYLFFCLLFCVTFVACKDTDHNENMPAVTSVRSANGVNGVEPAEKQTNITLAVGDDEVTSYQLLLTAFSSEQEQINVQVIGFGELTTNSDGNVIEAAAREADIFLVYSNFVPSVAHLLDLKPLIETDPDFNIGDFQPGLLNTSSTAVWSIPTSAEYPMIFYNRSAIAEAGLAEPEPGWTVGAFLAAAQTLTVREGDEVLRWGYVPNSLRRSPLLTTQLTAPLVQNDVPRFTDPDVIAASQWLADLFIRYQVAPWLDSFKPSAVQAGLSLEQWELMESGQAAIWQREHTLWQLGNYDVNVGITTIPRSANGYAADPLVTGFAISRGTQNAAAAWQLIDFLSRQPPTPPDQYLVPARRSVAAAMNYWETMPVELKPSLQYAVENNVSARWPPEANPLADALSDMIENGTATETALAAAQALAAEQTAGMEAATAAPEPFTVPTTVAETTTIEIQFATTWNEQAAHRALANAFESEHPEATINVSRELDSSVADCLAASVRVLPRIQAETALLPLDPFFELDPSVSPDGFYPGTFDQLEINAQIMGLPAWIDVPFVEYNRSLFNQLGIAEPTADWTMEEFLQTAQALTDEQAGRYGFMDWTQDMLSHGFTQFGIDPFTGNASSGATINFAATEPMILWYADLVRLHHVQPAQPGYLLESNTVFDRWERFENMVAEGEVGMWVGSISNQTLAERLVIGGVDVGIAPIPRGPSGHNVNIADGVTGYFISAETPHRQLCWEWINFLSTQPTASTYLPARIEVAESTAFAAHVGAEFAAYLPNETDAEVTEAARFADRVGTQRASAYHAALLYSSNDISLSATRSNWLAPSWIWLGIAYEQVAKEEADINLALAEAEQLFDSYRACVVDNNAFADQAQWRHCAIEVDERLAARYSN